MNAQLLEIGIKNFLGVGAEELRVSFQAKNALLVGKNNSGKTAVCEAIGALKRIGDQQFRTGQNSTGFNTGWSSCPDITSDFIHSGADEAELSWKFLVSAKILLAVPQMDHFAQLRGDESAVEVELRIGFRNGMKKLLGISVNGAALFLADRDTPLFELESEDRYHFRAENPINEFVFGLPKLMASRILYFAARRELANTDSPNLDTMAVGLGVGSWIKRATNADPKQSDAGSRYRTLTRFEREFADFMGVPSLRISATEYQTPTISIGERLLPISRLGAGIGECFLIMLVSRIAASNSSIPTIIVIDEPELHLHPAMQKQLIDSIGGAVQIISATHSPALLGEAYRKNWVILRSVAQDAAGVVVAPIDSANGVRDTHLELGLDAGEIVQSDGIIWVEGTIDVAFYRHILSQIPGLKGRQYVVMILAGGDASASEDIDLDDLKSLNNRQFVIFDSERAAAGGPPSGARLALAEKCKTANIKCHLTERRALENYFPIECVNSVMPGRKMVGPWEDFKAEKGYKTKHGRLIIQKMKWSDIAESDIGLALTKFVFDHD